MLRQDKKRSKNAEVDELANLAPEQIDKLLHQSQNSEVVAKRFGPKLVKKVERMQAELLARRCDPSILTSFFRYTFDDEFKIFMNKYNLSPRQLGPWLDTKDPVRRRVAKLKLPPATELARMSETERARVQAESDKVMSQIVKEVKSSLRKRSGLDPLAARAIAGSPPRIKTRDRSGRIFNEKVNALDLDKLKDAPLLEIGRSIESQGNRSFSSWRDLNSAHQRSSRSPLETIRVRDSAAKPDRPAGSPQPSTRLQHN